MNEKHILPVSNLKQVEETFINEKSNKPDRPKNDADIFWCNMRLLYNRNAKLWL